MGATFHKHCRKNLHLTHIYCYNLSHLFGNLLFSKFLIFEIKTDDKLHSNQTNKNIKKVDLKINLDKKNFNKNIDL